LDEWKGIARQPLTLNPYLYADANPVMYVDPSGYYTMVDMATASVVVGILSGISAATAKGYFQYVKNPNDAEAIARAAGQGYIEGLAGGLILASTAGDVLIATSAARTLWALKTGGLVGGIRGSKVVWKLGTFKSTAKWQSQMAKRGWTSEQITEAVQMGDKFTAENLVNRGNAATRYVHPETGRSIVVDDVTDEVIHVGGNYFRYWPEHGVCATTRRRNSRVSACKCNTDRP